MARDNQHKGEIRQFAPALPLEIKIFGVARLRVFLPGAVGQCADGGEATARAQRGRVEGRIMESVSGGAGHGVGILTPIVAKSKPESLATASRAGQFHGLP
jgi:hypothetical protein